jgi:hypothetical protein
MTEDRSEPSMEEILSSIKRIIADDEAIKAPARKIASRRKEVVKPEEGSEILELTESEAVAEQDEQLLDEGKAQILARSFSTLQTLAEPGQAPQIVRSGETSLEGLTRELMRPMLKDWLDENLPQIVEAMVEREISRITKKG